MAKSIRVPIEKLYFHQVRLGAAFLPAAKAGLKAGALRALPLLQQLTRTAPPASPNGSPGAVNTGAFLRSWKVRQQGPWSMSIINDHPAASVIEGGRKPGSFPPLAPIAKWAQRKLTRQTKSGKTGRMRQEDAEGVAFVIARAIAKRGLQGRHIMATAAPQLSKLVLEELALALDKAFMDAQ